MPIARPDPSAASPQHKPAARCLNLDLPSILARGFHCEEKQFEVGQKGGEESGQRVVGVRGMMGESGRQTLEMSKRNGSSNAPSR